MLAVGNCRPPQWFYVVYSLTRVGLAPGVVLHTNSTCVDWGITTYSRISLKNHYRAVSCPPAYAATLARSLHCQKILNRTHYDVIMSPMASQITSLTIVYSRAYSGTNQRKYQSSASLAFVRGIHRWPDNSPRKGPIMLKMFPFDDDIMTCMHIEATSWVIPRHKTAHATKVDPH